MNTEIGLLRVEMNRLHGENGALITNLALALDRCTEAALTEKTRTTGELARLTTAAATSVTDANNIAADVTRLNTAVTPLTAQMRQV